MVNPRVPAMERLLASQPKAQSKRSWYEFRNEAGDGPTELFIYDVVDEWFGVSAELFARELNSIDTDEITVRINSPGGSVFDGIAILNALRGHKAKITTVVDGLAASIASVIAMAGDEVVMGRNSELMIHDASSVCVGQAKDMQSMADNLARASNNIASIYAEKAGGTADEWRTAMLGESWYSAEEAVAAGLADRVDKAPEGDKSKAKNAFDLSIYNYAGRDAAPKPPVPGTSTPLATEASEVNKGKEVTIVTTLNEGLAERLGVKADADDETILSALDEALKEQVEETAPPVVEQEPTPEQIAASVAKSGGLIVDAAALAELQARAARGDEARTKQEKAERAAAVENAIHTGRIAPAQRDAWLNRLETDPTEAERLTNLAPVYPVGQEIGHAGTPVTDADDAIYAALFGTGA